MIRDPWIDFFIASTQTWRDLEIYSLSLILAWKLYNYKEWGEITDILWNNNPLMPGGNKKVAYT